MMEWMHTLTGLGLIPAFLLKLTLLLAAGWALYFALRGRNPRWRVLLWRGVMLGAAALPLLAWSGFFRVAVEIPAPPVPTPIMHMPSVPIDHPEPDERLSYTPLPSPATSPTWEPGLTPPPQLQPRFSLADWCLVHGVLLLWAAWGVGAALMGLRLLYGMRALRRLLRESSPAPERLQRLVEKIAADLDCPGGVTLRLPAPLGARLFSVLRPPVILLPERMAAPAYGRELPAVLAHELVHLRAADLAWTLGACVLTAALWFHPLAWRLQAAHAGACEEVSDAVVADYLKDAAGYARALARVALDMAGHAAPALGIPMARCSEITRRLRALKDCIHASPLARRRVAVFLMLGAVALLAIGGFKPIQARSNNPPLATTPPAAPAQMGISAMTTASNVSPSAADTATPAPGRILHFPQGRSVGWLQIVDARARREISTVYYWINGVEDKWAGLGEARGDVAIPAGKRVLLNIYNGEKDLSWLAGLQPDDLYALAWRNINDAGLAAMAGLKGLKILDLRDFSLGERTGLPKVSARGMQPLAALEDLEYLSLPDQMTDGHLDAIVRIKSLKGLYFGVNAISNDKVADLARLAGLEELAIGGTRMDDRGLAHLAALPRLQYLILEGKTFTDGALAHVAGFPSLKILHLGHQPITDAGLAHLARATSLERLALFDTQAGDAGMAALAGLPSLKYLDVHNTQVGKPGVAQIARIKSLEELHLPGNCLSDHELTLLAELPRLKRLELPNGYSTVGNNPIYYTDQGLARLCAKLPGLEFLDISGAGITDQGMASVGRLTNLRRLNIFGTPNITNKGYAALANLKNLEELCLMNVRITAAGLNQLGSLPNLKTIQLMVERDEDFRDARLDLSGLKSLEQAISLPSIKDEDLACFAGMTQLQWLQVGHKAGITDAGLAHLERLTNLDRLSVGGPGVTDAGLAHLAGMKKMDCLTLSGNFSDAGLRPLEGLKGLRNLNLHSTRNFSPAALNRLRASLPSLAFLTADPDRTGDLWKRRERRTTALDSAGSSSQRGGHPQAGRPAPDFTVKTLDGQEFKLSTQRGKVVLLNFWATWCRPCVASHPELVKLHDRLKKQFGDRVVMLNLALDDNDDLVRAYVQSDKLTWPQARIGQGSKIAAEYGVSGVPDAFLIGPDGKIVLNRESPETANDTDAVVTRLLEAGGGKH